EKSALAARLAREAQAPTDLVGFALFGPDDGSPTFGANRNAALLDTAGRRALTVDDDTTAALIGQPGVPGAVLDGSVPLGDVAIFDSLAEVVSSHDWTRTGPLGPHAAVLGQPLRAVGPGLPEGRVIITQMGIAGDTGTSTPFG